MKETRAWQSNLGLVTKQLRSPTPTQLKVSTLRSENSSQIFQMKTFLYFTLTGIEDLMLE